MYFLNAMARCADAVLPATDVLFILSAITSTVVFVVMLRTKKLYVFPDNLLIGSRYVNK